MVVHRFLADVELRGNRLVGCPFGDQPKDLQLAGAEAIGVVGAFALVSCGGLGEGFELCNEAGHSHLPRVSQRLLHQF